jgi:preprotein translocase subunit SecY
MILAIVAVESDNAEYPCLMRSRRGPAHVRQPEHYIPLKVNQSGVIPVIFASSLLSFRRSSRSRCRGRREDLDQRQRLVAHAELVLHPRLRIADPLLLVLYTAIAFNPAAAGRHHPQAGGFIPASGPDRPPSATSKVARRITLPGALFLVPSRWSRCSC